MVASRIKSWLVGFLWLIVAGCSAQRDPDAVLKEIFNAQEMVVVNQIIDYYDAYVWSKTDPSLPIEKAYQQFFDTNCNESGKESLFFPPVKERIQWISTLDKNLFADVINIKDSLYVYDRKTKELLEVLYYPYNFDIVLNGKIDRLLEILSPRSKFYATYREWGMQAGGIAAPLVYVIIHNSYPKNNPNRKNYTPNTAQFDFSQKEERFIAILPFLFYQMYSQGVAEMQDKYKKAIQIKDKPIER